MIGVIHFHVPSFCVLYSWFYSQSRECCVRRVLHVLSYLGFVEISRSSQKQMTLLTTIPIALCQLDIRYTRTQDLNKSYKFRGTTQVSMPRYESDYNTIWIWYNLSGIQYQDIYERHVMVWGSNSIWQYDYVFLWYDKCQKVIAMLRCM